MTKDRDDPFDRMFEEMLEQVTEMMEEMSNMDVEEMSEMNPEEFEDFDGDMNGFAFTNFGEGSGFGFPFGSGDPSDFPGMGMGAGAEPNTNPTPHANRDPTTQGSTHVDVLDEGTVVRVVADVPGVEKEEITVSVSGEELRIHAVRGEREYDERVGLPSGVDKESGDATYNNGVLEVSFEKHDREDEHEIDIE